ncbi:MAG: hypothetical protein JWR54_3620 [Mucilaginibacter sp.]|nr:hypothetical protein [Mucilaginibacter sp.]
MHRHTAFRLFFILAALLFIGKPFFGYGVSIRELRPRQVHTILVKSFSKRKPESLEDADANVAYLHQLLINPLAVIFSAISFLLITLFPIIFRNGPNITDKILSDIRYALLPPEPAYLLAGKLII